MEGGGGTKANGWDSVAGGRSDFKAVGINTTPCKLGPMTNASASRSRQPL